MHVLITGGAGFIGTHLTRRLLARGDTVSILDNLTTGSYDNIREFIHQPHYAFALDDLSNTLVLDRLASEADAIVHLAAAVGVQLVVERPTATIETNVLGTHAVLQAARRYRCRTLIASTSEVYGKGVRVPFNENDDILLGPSSRSRWSYAASKLLDEFLGLAAHREFDLPVTIMRFFNTVGPGQSGRYGMVVPRFVRQALADAPITVYGDGTQSRCFCHVADTVDALIRLLDGPAETVGEIYNIGSSQEISIRALAERVIARAESASEIVQIPYSQAYAPGFEDMQRRVPDTHKIQAAVGWQAQIDLDRILDDVVAYERPRMDKERAEMEQTGMEQAGIEQTDTE
ncbi:MAG: GDP-mannose 4,6-dehydratase [Litorilinea sp.]